MSVCPGHPPPCSGHSTVVNWTSPGLVSSPAHPGHSPGASGRGGLLSRLASTQRPPSGPGAWLLQPPGPKPDPGGGLRTHSWSAEQPVGSVALTGPVLPPAAVAAGSLFADDDFQVGTGQSGLEPRACFPLSSVPERCGPVDGAHMLRGSRGHRYMAWEDLSFLFFACVYFLKWSAIIFTIKGSYESSDFSEKHSSELLGGRPSCCLSGAFLWGVWSDPMRASSF